MTATKGSEDSGKQPLPGDLADYKRAVEQAVNSPEHREAVSKLEPSFRF